MKMMKSFAIILILVLIINLVIIETTTGETSVQSRNESERITGWMISTVEDWGKISGESSLALDTNNVPHVSYYDKDLDVLWYAFWNGERWERNNIDGGGYVEIDNFIAVDSENVPHLIYSHYNSLKYAKKNGTSWEIEIVDNNGFSSYTFSLAIDSKNYPHISCFDGHNTDLKYATWNGSTWSIETVDDLGNVGYGNSLALDSNDHPHIIYTDLINGTRKYATWNGSSWSIEILNNFSGTGFSRSIDIDSFDHPHLCYYDRLNKSLKYARWDGTDWITNTVVNTTVYGGSFILDKNDCPSIVYSTSYLTGSNDQNLTFAKWTSGSWNIELINIYKRLSGISMDIDENGDPHIGYVVENPNYDMKYAWLVRNPTPPRNLTSDHGDGFVRLSWDLPLEDGNSKIQKYNIYRGKKSGSKFMLGNVTYPTSFYNDTSVINGQNYYYYITAENFVDESGPSNEISSIPMGLPGAPLIVKSMSGDSYILITWDEPFDNGGSEIIEYQIFRGYQQNNLSYLGKVSSDERYFNDTSVINGQKYYYFITAVNSVGIGERSKSVSSTPFGLPSTPRNILALSGNRFVVISWENPLDNGGSEITGFRIHRSDTDGKNVVHSVHSSFSSYNDTTVSNGRSYTYYVSAVTIIGEGESSLVVVGDPSSIPSPPLNVHLIAGDGFINILWDQLSDDGGMDIIKYHIFRGYSPEDVERIKSVSGSTYSYNDTYVENGIKYYYHIIAENSRGDSDASDDIWGIPLGYPSPPLNFKIISGFDYIRLSWDEPLDNGGSNIIHYMIYRGLMSGGLSLFFTTDQNTSTYNDTSVLSGKTYYYFITAISYYGEGERSEEIIGSPEILISPPSSPINLTILLINRGIILTWEPPIYSGGTELIEYRIYKDNGSGDMVLIETISPSYTIFIDDEVQIGNQYYYSISAVNSAGESNKSTSIVLSLEEQGNNDNELSILIVIIIFSIITSFCTLTFVGFILIKKTRSSVSEKETDSSNNSINQNNEYTIQIDKSMNE